VCTVNRHVFAGGPDRTALLVNGTFNHAVPVAVSSRVWTVRLTVWTPFRAVNVTTGTHNKPIDGTAYPRFSCNHGVSLRRPSWAALCRNLAWSASLSEIL
jgi:hypothetical protein